jgi:hypothetical protein
MKSTLFTANMTQKLLIVSLGACWGNKTIKSYLHVVCKNHIDDKNESSLQ